MNWRDFVSVQDYLTPGGMDKKVYWSNGVLIGECVQDVDGYWKFGFRRDRVAALWDAYVFEILAAMLNEMNHEWDETIKRELGDGSTSSD